MKVQLMQGIITQMRQNKTVPVTIALNYSADIM